jgi:predicted acylesterase/phospholipase RssA
VGVSVGFNNWNGAAPTNMFQVFIRALASAQKHQSASWQSAADILIEPEVQSVDWDELHRADEAIAAGAVAARSAVPRLRELLDLPANAQPEPKPRPAGSAGWKERAAL